MKKKKWPIKIVTAAALLIALCITAAVAIKAQAFDDYYVLDNNDLAIVIKQAKSSSTTTVKYGTNTWYLFPEPIGAADSDTVDTSYYEKYSEGTPINLAFYNAEGLSLKSGVQTTVDIDSNYRQDTFTFPAEQIMGKLKQWYTAGSLNRDALKNGVTLYASRSLNIIWSGDPKKTVYSYPEMEAYSKANHIGWGAKAWDTFHDQTYDQIITVQFKSVPFTSRIVKLDAEGKQTDEESYNLAAFPYNDIYYGETLQGTAPTAEVGYKCIGWELTSGSWSKSGSGATVSYTANSNDIDEIEGLVLTFKFQEVKAEMPFSSPTPEPTRAPGATATPTPTPTVTPTPAPPTPTSQPTVNKDYMDSEEWYFSTDQGYYMEQVAGSTTYKIATEASGTAGGSVAESTYTSRDNYYQEGYDRNGNYWYFIPSGSDATYVHPKKYNGYLVDSANVKYITELVFPDTIYVYSYAIINGVPTETETPYTVRSIGGGTSKFKKADKSSSYGGSTSISYNYGTESGSYYWSYWSESSSQYNSHNREISYKYGVIGNGEIKSDGSQSFSYLNAGTYTWRGYYRYYYVYNTTLEKVVIPSTVTSISPYAFQYCQALETIEGGENLLTIDTRAFEADSEPKVRLSNEYKSSSGSAIMDIRDYYYYNTSYSKTDYTAAMLAWREVSYLCDEMIFPYLPKLKTINYAAFSGHYNIDDVDLSPTVSTIGIDAFIGCELENIRIPNASAVITESTTSNSSNANTLGTKGYSLAGDTTKLHCAPDSTAMAYGLKHDGFYVLYCGHPVTYHPNGAPGSTQELYGALNINYLNISGELYDYANMQQVYNSTSPYPSYSSNGSNNRSYLDEDGHLWWANGSTKQASLVTQTTFKELVPISYPGGYYPPYAYYAVGADGSVWWSGQVQHISTYTDSDGYDSAYSWYNSISGWKQLPIEANHKQICAYATGIYVLNSSGMIQFVSPENGYVTRISDPEQSFTAFSVLVQSDRTYIAAVDASGAVWYVPGYTGGGTTADDWKQVMCTVPARGVMIGKSKGSNGYQFFENIYIFGTDGNTYAERYGNSSASRVYTVSSGTNFVSGEVFSGLAYGNCVFVMTDTSGARYLISSNGGGSYRIYADTMVQLTSTASEKLPQMWGNSTGCGDGYATDDYESVVSYEFYYLWYADGTMKVVYKKEGNYSAYVSTAGAKFKEISKSTDTVLALAEDGTLWTAGDNEYGQLGHSAGWGYDYPAPGNYANFVKTGSRTYQEIYAGGSTSYARGTDGKIYRAGGNEYSYTFDVYEYGWPASATTVPKRYIAGYDYNTIIVSNPYTYNNYEFKGWNTTAGGTGTAYFPGDAVELTGAITLYAQWGKTNNIIRYDRNGGTGSMSNTVLDYDTTTTTLSPNRFAREGYEFTGWNTYANGGGTAYADGATITVGKGTTTTLYAQWREIVTNYTLVYMKYPYGTSGNTAWKSKTLSYRAVETVEGQPYTPSGAYTVTYNINKPAGMSSVPSALAKTSDSTPAPSFSKWRLYTKNAEGEYVYGGRQYAKGETLSQLTNENGGVVYLYPSWQTTGSYVVLPYTEADGYVFDGWNETADGSGALYPVYPPEDSENVGLYTPSKSTTLYGTWTPLTKTLALDATNKAAAAAGMSATVSNPQASVEVTFDAVAPNAKAPSCSRWVFMGYYTKLDAAGNPTADSVKVYDTNRNADGTYATYTRGVTAMNNVNGTFDTISTLYAFWVPDKAVSYEPNYSPVDAACPSMETTWVDFDKDYVDLPANKFTKTGYHFTNWNTKANNSGTSYADKGRVTGITGRLTLYAQWAPNKYSVTLSQPDATTQGTTAVTATYDAAMPSVIIPKREYTVSFNANTGTCATTSLISKYTFGGYYTGTGGSGIQYYKADGTSARIWDITQNTTLYAKWTSVSVTLPAAEKRGYDFLGWYTEAVNGTKIGDAGNTYTPTAGITLYAHWKAKEFDITLNDRGATSTNHTGTVHMTYDQKGASVTVPTKTGYTFHGYYTGTHGTGTRYYDASGVCVKEWTEVDVTQIYAYWTQNDVLLPEVGDRTEPTPLPELEAEGSVGRSDPKGLLYADDYNDATDALTDLQPYLTYDAGTSEGAIPGTEKIAFRAKMGSWMLHYKLHRNTGTDYVRFYVTVPYRTQYEQSADEELVISEQQKKTYTFVVPKVWSYWEILESGMYYPDKVTVTNSATKDTSFTVNVNRAGSFAIVPPAYDVEQYGDKTTHVFWDEYDTDGYPILRITLTEEQYIISDVRDTLPDVDAYLARVCGNAAWLDTRQATVRNDRFILDGQSILSDIENKTGNGTELCPDVLEYYTSDGAIEETSYLQTYQPGIELNETIPNGCYVTSAEITYVGVSENIGSPATETVQLKDINNLKIHTPVACSGRVADGMETTEEGYVLILQDALNFFTLSIDNTGIHRMNPGYGEKNFNRALSGKSNVAEQDGKQLNQVCFPFDVYVDVGNDSKISDGCCSPEGDYLLQAGIWLTLGLEEQSFYVPVTMKNGKYQIKFRSVAVNCPRDENGQYIFGEEEYLVNLSPSCYVAADAINVEVRSYLRDFRITFVNDPLAAEQLEKGCQALTLKKGYGFFFELLSQGEFYGKNAEISIVPSYFFESEDGAERKEVKLFRLEKLPENGGKNCYAWEGEPILLNHENYEVIKQRFCGNGMVPENVLCVEKNYPLEEYAGQTTFTGKEDFFLQNGFLIIRFDIIVKSNEGVPYVFNAWENTMLAEHAKQQGWNFIPGDVIRYDLTKCISDDYEIGGSE